MEALSPRERVLLAIDRKETDRLPIDFGGRVSGISLSVYAEVKKILGVNTTLQTFSNRLQTALVDEEILRLFRVDTRHIRPAPAESWDSRLQGSNSYRNEWGMKLERLDGGYYYDFADAPLAGAKIEDIDAYKWPDSHDLSRAKGKREEARALTQDGKYALFTGFKGVFERAWALRGMEQFFMDMIADREFVEALLDKVLEVQKAIYGPYLEALAPYLDVVTYTEDLGTQTSPLISPKIYRELIKPRHAELIKFVHEKCQARIAFHSCGSVLEFLSDFKDLGVEIINPVQVSAEGMEPQALKENYGEHFCFWGALDTQKLLPVATLPEVDEAVKRTASILGERGGYIFAPAHNIQPLTPPENVIRMFEVARDL